MNESHSDCNLCCFASTCMTEGVQCMLDVFFITGKKKSSAGNILAIEPFNITNTLIFLYPPQTVFVGGYTVFTLSDRPCVRTFCFLNILKNH